MGKYSYVLEKFLGLQQRCNDRPNEKELSKIHEDAKPYAEDFLREGFEPELLVKILGPEVILDHSDVADEETLILARKSYVKKNIRSIFKDNFENLPDGITPTFVAENCDEVYLHDLAEDSLLIGAYVNKGGVPEILFDRVVDVYGYGDFGIITTIIAYGKVSEFDENKLRESFANAHLKNSYKDYYAQLLTVSGFWDYEEAEKFVSGRLY